MAGTGWRTENSLIDQLRTEPERFDPFEAVKLLETNALQSGSEAAPSVVLGSGSDAAHEAIRFASSIGSAFPASHIEEIRRHTAPSGRVRFTVRTSFMGLAGGFGPLPATVTEKLVERTRAGDFAMRDFLDLFNHRLISLLIRARRTYRPELTLQAPWQSNLAKYVAALCGIGTGHLQDRLPFPDRALFRHVGILNRTIATQHGLERLLSEHFRVPITIQPLTGAWLALEPEDVSRLGGRGDSLRLGRGAVLGQQVWDQSAGVTVALFDLTLRQYLSFLPGGRAAREMAALIAFHAGPNLIVTLSLRLRPASRPSLRLSHGKGQMLGRTTFLATTRRGKSAAVTRLSAMEPTAKIWVMGQASTT